MSTSEKDMNCEDFKKAIAADPSATFEGAGHAAGCTDCAAFQADMQALDARIGKALAIDVPKLTMPELPPLEDDNVVNLPFARRGRAPAWLAIAASFALAAVIVTQYLGEPAVYDSLADEIVAHLDHEPNALKVTDAAVSERRFSRVVNESVGTMDRNVGLITYAQSCVINGKTVPHLVIQGEAGPITLLLMPDEMVDMAQQINGNGINGVILPVGDGSIAIIGERGENLAEVEQRVIDSVEWSI